MVQGLKGQEIFFSPQKHSDQGCLLFNVYCVSFPGGKWLGCDVDQLPPSRAENTCTPLYSFMVWKGTTLLFLTSLNLGQDTCDPDWSSFFLPPLTKANARFIFQGGYGCFLLRYHIIIQHSIIHVIRDPVHIVK